jgi:anaerobic dimethyl sulfoxide reductase subunit B (iron-sulfur subunit)
MQKALDDGTVQHEDALCIGCGTCVKTCPYQVPVLLPDRGNIAGKCDACKPFRDAGKNPVCVDACIMRCLDFGDTEELRARYGPDLTNALPVLASPDTTHPNTLIKPKKAALEAVSREVSI